MSKIELIQASQTLQNFANPDFWASKTQEYIDASAADQNLTRRYGRLNSLLKLTRIGARIDPINAYAHRRLSGRALAGLGRHEEALRYFESALLNHPGASQSDYPTFENDYLGGVNHISSFPPETAQSARDHAIDVISSLCGKLPSHEYAYNDFLAQLHADSGRPITALHHAENSVLLYCGSSEEEACQDLVKKYIQLEQNITINATSLVETPERDKALSELMATGQSIYRLFSARPDLDRLGKDFIVLSTWIREYGEPEYSVEDLKQPAPKSP